MIEELEKGNLRPYPDYRVAGIPHLEQVPRHWGVPCLGQIGTLAKGMGGNKDDERPEGLPCVRYGDLYTTHKNFIERTRSFIDPEDHDKYTRIRPGDVLFAASGETIEEIGKSAVNLIEGPAYCGGDIILFRPSSPLIPRYMGYAMDCKPIADQKAVMGRGFTVYHIYGRQLKYLRFPIPPPDEQDALVRFLDHADEQIQRYIAGKERLIALLEEERRALVHQAVTRGLDPSVRLKPSGVEWLRHIPEDWELSRVKNEFQSLNHLRVPLSTTERGAMNAQVYSYYGASGIIDKVESYLFDDDLLLLAEDGANLVLRNLPLAIIARGKFWVNNHAHVLKPKKGNLEFLAAVMEGINYLPWISGAAQPKLTLERLLSIPIAVPTPAGQNDIIDKVRATTHPKTSAIEQARRQINLLNEYRTRLIADVVTGQLDVREAAAKDHTQSQ